MKCTAEQCQKRLSGTLDGFYWISGDEPLLIDELCDAIRKRCRNEGILGREIFHADARFDWQQIIDSVSSPSLFGDRTLIEVHLSTGKAGDAGSTALSMLSKTTPDNAVILLRSERLDSAMTKKKWFQGVESTGVVVQIWPVDIEQFPAWMSQRLAQSGLSAEREALELLCERLEGNLLAAAQEITKLQLLVGDNARVTLDHAQQLVADSARFDVFQLADALLEANAERSLRIFRGLLEEGTELTLVVWALQKEFRALLALRRCATSTSATETLFKQLRVFNRRKQSAYRQAARRFSDEKLLQQLLEVQTLDASLKGLSPHTDAACAIEALLVTACCKPSAA